MRRQLTILFGIIAVCLIGPQLLAEQAVHLQHADEHEIVMSPEGDTVFFWGSVIFETDSGLIYSDSAIWAVRKSLNLRGKVVIDEISYRLAADSVYYDLVTSEATARGSYVELWSKPDSIFAVGTHVYYDRPRRHFRMEERPTLYLKYPDSAAMIRVVAENIDYDADSALAQADGDVLITSRDLSSRSGCALMHSRENLLDLFDGPVVQRGKSTLRGALISILSLKGLVSRIEVLDSARGDFKEPSGSDPSRVDNSTLTGKHIVLDFDNGELNSVRSFGQAYSWYYPAPRDDREEQQNSVSGDTIQFDVAQERLQSVTVIGGSVGRYLSTKRQEKDTTISVTTDTVDYSGATIVYSLGDSTISLYRQAHVTSGSVVLDAHKIVFLTQHQLVKAYSAAVSNDSTARDTASTARLQPNAIPVVLKDKTEELYGDFLEYSVETQKGRIVQSKSKYETGFYYGEKVFRTDKVTYYVDQGRYTTCDADEPHFHFYSRHMKLMQDNKLIAKPVVLSVGRIPILALPYYVFPLKKGRHSGFLPFRVGNIERGQRYIENVGYYWAPSDYWDWQNGMNYHETNSAITYTSQFQYKKQYVFNGRVAMNLTKETSYDSYYARERKPTKWTLDASHHHEFSPTFKIDASGSYQSDSRYYNDYSSDLAARTNRNVLSKVNFSKRFGRTVSLSGTFSHETNIDAKSRTDYVPSLALNNVPVLRPFGSGKTDSEGRIVPRWYNNLTIAYRTSMVNFSSRITKIDGVDTLSADTTVDTVGGSTYSTISHVVTDTLSHRSRKEYARIDHSIGVNFPMNIASYFVFNPTFSYSENWFKIHHTDQSDSAKIDASQSYRTYSYSMGATLSTNVYGTVHPNILGLLGLRQVLSPSVSYSYIPRLDQHPNERKYVGASAGSSDEQSLLSAGLRQVYQAKIRNGEGEKNLELFSLNSGFSYNFRKHTKPFSDLTTSFQSQVLPKVSFSGAMVHSLYKLGTDDLDLLSPHLLSFNFMTGITISGRRFLFDEPAAVVPRGADSASQVSAQGAVRPAAASAPAGWSMSVSYTYDESGIGSNFRKSSFLRFSLRFNLTPNTTVGYAQAFDPVAGRTISNSVSIVRKLHCWTGEFSWVPTGSTAGYSFRLYVTAIPAIKLDNTNSMVSSSFIQNIGE